MTERTPMPSPGLAPGIVPGPPVTAGVLLMAATTIMANATISPALPSLRAHYAGLPAIDTLSGLLITLPSLAVVLTAGPFGWLADRVDRQRLLLAAAALYVLGGTSGLWVAGLVPLLVGRLVLGVGVAGMMVLATAWAGDLWVGPARARFLGLQGAFVSAGGVVVVLVGGALTSLHWRGAFATYLLALPVTLLALIALAPHARRLRAIPRQLRSADPAMPWGAFAFIGSLGLLFMASIYLIPTRLPFLLAERGVANPVVMAGVLCTATVFSLPGSLLYGRIRRRLSAMAVFAASWALMGAGTLVLAFAPTLPGMVAGVALMGIGIGPSLPNYTAYWLGVVPPGLRGRAAGMLTTAFFAGQFVSPLITAPLAEGLGLAGAFAAMAVAQLCLAGCLGLMTLRTARAASNSTRLLEGSLP